MPVSTLQPDFLWFCQLSRDGEFVGTKELAPRLPTLEYLSGMIETAAEAGFSSLLTATNYHHENETWTAGVAALARTRGAGLLLAVRPGMFGPAQYAVAKAVADCLAEGTIPQDLADELVIICGVFIHPAAADNKKILDYNYEATKLSIQRAMKGEPSVTEVIKGKDTAKHPFAG